MGYNKSPKMELMVVKAIRRLQDTHGSTAREINEYISQEFGVPPSSIKKSVQIALKKALNFGILKNRHGHYVYNCDLISDDPIDEARHILEENVRKKRVSRGRKKSTRKTNRMKTTRKRTKSKKRRLIKPRIDLKATAITALSRARNGSHSDCSSSASIAEALIDDKQDGSHQNDSQEE